MPDHWQESTLGEIADLEIGKTPPRNASQYWTDSLERPFCTIADMDGHVIKPSREGVTELAEDHNKARRISAGSLLMSFKLTIGRMAFAGCDLFPNEAIVAITPDEVSASREFLYLNLGSRDLTEGSGQAVKGKTLNSKSLRAINIHLPPLEEQRRIVDLVGSIDTYIDNLEAQIDKTRTARSALLSELLSNPGDDWQETTLGEVAKVRSGFAFKSTDFCDQGHPVVKISNVKDGEVDLEGCTFLPDEIALSRPESLLQRGDLLITMTGDVGAVGRLNEESAVLNQRVGKVVVSGKSVDVGFVFVFLRDIGTRLAIQQLAAGNAQPNVSPKSLHSLAFPLPPIPQQQQIVGLVGSFDEQISSLESQVELVRALRSGVLSELLSGERLLDESYDMAVGL